MIFNFAQREAIRAPLAHMIINASAGTGKTSTIAARIHFMQTELDIAPNSILAISFSRTARIRLTDKLKEICKQNRSGSPVPTYTFHGLAFRILRIAASLGETWLRPGFEIFDPLSQGFNPIVEKKDLLLAGFINGNDSITAWCAYIKAIEILKQGSDDVPVHLDPKQLDRQKKFQVEIDQNTWIKLNASDIRTVWERIQRHLFQTNAIDYAGMITEAIRVLSLPASETRQRITENLQVIVVDEYQDTSKAQAELLFALSANNLPINVVGDADQTIYSFNGSSACNLQEFYSRASESDIPILEPIHMNENYRSAEPILNLSNRVRGNLSTDRKLIPASNVDEGPLLTYRQNNIPVHLVYAPKLELAADFVAYEINRLISTERIQNIAVLVRKDSEYAPQASVVMEALSIYGLQSELMTSKTQIDREAHFQFLYDLFQDQEYYGQPLSDLLSTQQLKLPDTLTREDFSQYIQEAIHSGAEYCFEAIDFIFDNMNTDILNVSNHKDIKVGTIHSAKGEEFRVVFLLYLGDRSFPHGSKPDLDEERRLLYVGITRAQERLYILGRPGIHTEDFFGKCIGPDTKYIEHTIPSNITDTFEPISQDNGLDLTTLDAIEKARSKQSQQTNKDKEDLWKSFEEEYLM